MDRLTQVIPAADLRRAVLDNLDGGRAVAGPDRPPPAPRAWETRPALVWLADRLLDHAEDAAVAGQYGLSESLEALRAFALVMADHAPAPLRVVWAPAPDTDAQEGE